VSSCNLHMHLVDHGALTEQRRRHGTGSPAVCELRSPRCAIWEESLSGRWHLPSPGRRHVRQAANKELDRAVRRRGRPNPPARHQRGPRARKASRSHLAHA
jgi:hypothetical protein